VGIEEVGTETTAPRCVETFVEVNAFDSSSNVQMTKVFMTGPERKKSLKKLERISSQLFRRGFGIGGPGRTRKRGKRSAFSILPLFKRGAVDISISFYNLNNTP
jgi:hypothetical protein